MPQSKLKMKVTGRNDETVLISPSDGSHKACLVARLAVRNACPVLVLLKNAKIAARFLDDLAFFLGRDKDRVVYFPGYHLQPYKSLNYHRETSTSRLAALAKMTSAADRPLVIVTVLDTVLQKLIPKDRFNDYSELVMANEEIDRDALVQKLDSGGYNRVSLVEDPGEYAVRGGLLDVYSPGDDHPVRIEFFGDLVESIRSFSVYSQRGIDELPETVLIPATEAIIVESQFPHIFARLRQFGTQAGIGSDRIRDYINEIRTKGRFPGIESMLSIIYEKLDTLFEYLPDNTVMVMDEADELQAGARDIEEKIKLNYQSTAKDKRLCVSPASIYISWEEFTLQSRAHERFLFKMLDVHAHRQAGDQRVVTIPYHDNTALSSALNRPEKTDHILKPLVDWLNKNKKAQHHTLCVLHQKAQSRRLISLLKPYGLQPEFCPEFEINKPLPPGIFYCIAHVSTGFVMPEDNLAIVTENEIFGKKRIRRRATATSNLKSSFIAPEELKKGDIVVHVEHGVGQYEGLCSLSVNGISQDFILLLYQDEDRLYLPVDRIEMIGKYVGVDGYTPVLDKIGSKSWNKSKAKAKKEVEKLAADLLDLYAKRRVSKGFSFSRPDNDYNDFEATFPYEETRDQLKAIDEVHLDMEAATPMDRLVCGDVGYGKTEVAIRAAFKAVNDGKQVAVVVPTTILAEQHLSTFRERFVKYPVNIECLSRFRTRKEQNDIIAKISNGLVDIAIGTHRLLQADVNFKALGLLVIDEEQRFGVKHKEALKKKRSTVDVLALTATPIPRTLHLSLTGMRDISVISTPPADRQPIISYISAYEAAIVKDAVRKELARKGQVFFVHNNIKTISKMSEALEDLVPEAKVGIAHGRLSETELETIMLKFVTQEINLLVCTTIIESGLDIPSANTMIINKAERFGLAQIYQLRGRIGRGDHQAYAYLFVSDENRLTKDAKKRLAALMEHKDLGSGFQIAMKDLQIRGAGTALGASQSGHIAAVGYNMFLKLLDQAIRDLNGQAAVEPLEPEINAAMSAGFPEDYIESVEQRLTLYRRLSRLSRMSDISDMKKELTDRYGKLPREAENMLLKIMLRVYCIKAGVKRIDLNPNLVKLVFCDQHIEKPWEDILVQIKSLYPVKTRQKFNLSIELGRKRKHVSKALLETRDILKIIAS